MAGSLISGEGMVQNLFESLTDKITEIVDKAIMEKLDAVVYEIIKPQLAEQMEGIFKSAPVQMEASKMFNRELFPIYKHTLDDFANFNSLVKEVNKDIDTAIEEYANEIISNKDNENKKTEAKQKLMNKLKGISDKKTGDVLSMKGGDLQSFLGNVDNQFKPIEGGSPSPNYLSDGTKIVSEAIEQIVGRLKDSREELKTKIDESIKMNADHRTERINSMRKRKPKSDIYKMTESLGNAANALADIGNKATGGNQAINALGAMGKKATSIKLSGGKSKRRKPRKRNKTYKKRR